MVSKQYLAGFIDGEGCFNIAKDRTTWFPRLLIGNTNLEVLSMIKETYGGDIQLMHKAVEPLNWKQSWMYRAAGKTFRVILSDVYEYLIIKKPQADLCLEMFTYKDAERRFEIKQKMNILNKKGIK